MRALCRPRRYQLRKEAVRLVAAGHPWLFRGQMSSAAQVFRDGQWLRLFDHENRVVGYGMYQAEGAVAVRLLERSERAPDAAWARERVDAALARRAALRDETDSLRAVHGESDGLPAVVVDVYGTTCVLMTYAAGADALGRLVAGEVARRLELTGIVWKPARRRVGGSGGGAVGAGAGAATGAGGSAGARVLCGDALTGPLAVHEGPLTLWVDPAAGQKSGGFLDLRGLRRRLCGMGDELAGARVLNLFSYTGGLGLAAAAAGAAEVRNVDASAAALELGRRHHAHPAQRWTEADVFDWLPRLDPAEQFDLVIADPPPMTSRVSQVGRALASYRRLYRAAAAHVAAGGRVIACCCTSRIELPGFRRAVAAGLGPDFVLEDRLATEVDHPVGFPEADYLKILSFRRAPAVRDISMEP